MAARGGKRSQQTIKFQTLCDFISDYLTTRGTLSSYDASKLRTIRSHRQRLEMLLDLLNTSTDKDIYEDLRDALACDPDCRWFLEQLERADGSSDSAAAAAVSEEDPREMEMTMKRLSRTLSVKPAQPAASKMSFIRESHIELQQQEDTGSGAASECETNDILKKKFQQLHKDVLTVDLSPVISDLFSQFVITADQLNILESMTDSKARTQRLLTMLHTSKNPRAFVALRQAMLDNPPTMSQLVERIDRLQLDRESVTSQSELQTRRESQETGLKATAVRNYKASESDELSFVVGDVIHVLKQGSREWWYGRNADGKTGTFPAQFVDISSDARAPSAGVGSLSVTQLSTLPDGQHVSGVAFLADKIYIVRSSDQKIEVYNADNFSFIRHIAISDLARPTDMAACARNRCIYIADSLDDAGKDSRILRVDPVSGKVTCSWLVGDSAECLSVSTASGTVIATCGAVGKIKEFTADGTRVRVVILHDSVKNPWHAILLSPTDFLVCHGNDASDEHRVCKVNPKDCSPPTASFGAGAVDEKLKVPFQAAVHQSRDVIFVTDTFNKRIAVLDGSSLKLLRYIFITTDDGGKTGDGVKAEELFPSNVCVDESRDRLYASFNSFKETVVGVNKVKIFQLKFT